ncbi:MAG: HAMP domain-containing sensor histidine kinase [Pseudomonadota bacterium]
MLDILEKDALKVLLVDDDSADRILVGRLLSRGELDVNLLESEDASAALAVDTEDVDVILLDYFLPGLSGLDAIANLKARWPWAAIVVLTGQGDESVAKQAIQMGAVDYMSKKKLTRESLWRVIENGVELAFMRWRLEQQREELSQFAEMMLHDFKAPVRALLFTSEEISEGLDRADDTSLREDVDLIQRTARQMRDLLSALSDHVRHDHDNLGNQVNLADAVATAQAVLSCELKELSAKVECDLQAPDFQGSPAQIAQVMQNVIGNALKYRSDAVPPHIKVESRSGPHDSVEIIISDNGIGIAPEYHKVVFEPFRRGPATHGQRGSGLGLATCRRIVRRHGGRIWCEESALGGTAIHMEVAREARSADRRISGAQLRMLAVEAARPERQPVLRRLLK